MSRADISVLVVGGRTTGLMLASELARHGVSVRIIDKSSEIDPRSRANLVHSRTLEILQGLGLAERVLEVSRPERAVRIYVNGALVGESRHAPIASAFPYGMSQTQPRTEAVLESHLRSLGASVERSVQLVGVREVDEGVRATLLRPDGQEETVHASWLVGCDGAHSTVRHLVGCAFPGDADPYRYVLADVQVEGPLALDTAHVFLHDEGDLFVFTAFGVGRRLIVANMSEGQRIEGSPTLAQIQALVSRRGLSDIRLSEPDWLGSFHIHYRLAPHYRHGRVFLAGDAAHVHSLLAGHGMNVGIQDAFNLAWKLALVIRGVVPAWWLDTYETERRQVARDVLRTTRAATENAEVFTKLSPADREKLVAHMFVPEPERLKAAEHLQEVDLDYRGSAICIEGVGDFPAGPHAGAQAPDAHPLVVNGRELSLHQLWTGTKHRLLFFRGAMPASRPATIGRFLEDVLSEHRDWIEGFVVDSGDGEVASVAPGVTLIRDPTASMHQRFGADRPCIYLVRPDGYTAYRSQRLDSLPDYLDRVLGRPGPLGGQQQDIGSAPTPRMAP